MRYPFEEKEKTVMANQDQKKSPARESAERERKRKHEEEDNLEEGLEDTFPASDPVSATQPKKHKTNGER